MDSSVPLMYYDPSDFGLICFNVEETQKNLILFPSRNAPIKILLMSGRQIANMVQATCGLITFGYEGQEQNRQ